LVLNRLQHLELLGIRIDVCGVGVVEQALALHPGRVQIQIQRPILTLDEPLFTGSGALQNFWQSSVVALSSSSAVPIHVRLGQILSPSPFSFLVLTNNYIFALLSVSDFLFVFLEVGDEVDALLEVGAVFLEFAFIVADLLGKVFVQVDVHLLALLVQHAHLFFAALFGVVAVFGVLVCYILHICIVRALL